MAVKTLQVTQTGSAVQVSATSILARWIMFQNTAAAIQTIGDSAVTATNGYVLPASSGNVVLPPMIDGHYELSQWWTIGTNTQKLSIVYDSMN